MINIYIQRQEQFLNELIKKIEFPAVKIRQAMTYSLFPGGKRIRPIFVYLAGQLIDLDLEILDVIAASIELTHCYSLVHDDLPAMDNDDMRRGKPSCHKAFDEATAILVGDGMQALAIEVLLNGLASLVNAEKIIAITQILLSASGVSGMVSGQSLDLSELGKTIVTEAQLKTIHQLKTGRLILACFEMVLAVNSEVSRDKAIALKIYAEHIGLVFQMQDDYLDYYAPEQVLGKGRSSDVANEKTTFATLFTRQQLEKKIVTHFQKAIDALTVFGDRTDNLVALTRQLQKRSELG